MPSIDGPSKSIIKSTFSAKIWAATAAKIYRSDVRTGRWVQICPAGALLLMRDEKDDTKAVRLRLVDAEEQESAAQVLWEHELWLGFEFTRMEPYFYHFHSDTCVYGVLFADCKEAADFAKNVGRRVDKMRLGGGPASTTDDSASIKSFASGNTNGSRRSSFLKSLFSSGASTASNTNTTANGNANGNKSPSRLQATSSGNRQISAQDIGDPTGFKHLGHIGFNPESGTFDLKNIPPHWRKWLQASGASDADLQDRETATFIAGFLQQQVGYADVSPNMNSGSHSPLAARNGPPVARASPGAGRLYPPVPSAARPNPPVSGAARLNPPVRKAPPPPPPPKRSTDPPPPRPTATSRPTPGNVVPAASRPPPASAAPPARTAGPIPAAPPYSEYLAFLAERKARAEAAAEATPKAPPPRPAPAGPSLNDQLLAGIRQAGKASLKPVEQSPTPPSPSMAELPGDAMSSLLAKALQSRHRAVAMSESDDDDGEWA